MMNFYGQTIALLRIAVNNTVGDIGRLDLSRSSSNSPNSPARQLANCPCEPAGGRRRLAQMTVHEFADRLAGSVVNVDQQLDAEFEARLAESSTLAFRVAYGVLRHRQDAEDVAQEAFVKAYRSFRQLRDRDRFRAWLVRMTWRLALDRQRGDRRRATREARPWRASPPVADAAEDLVARERATQLWAAIDALPDKLRVVVVLSNIEGHDVRRGRTAAGAAARHGEVAPVSRAATFEGALAMDAERSRRAMTDTAIDREIQAALAVDPSPQFVARVRTRIASEPARATSWLSWKLVASGAMAALIVIAFVLTRPGEPDLQRSS